MLIFGEQSSRAEKFACVVEKDTLSVYLKLFCPPVWLTLHCPIDITGRSMGGEDAYDEPDCLTLVPSFRGLAILGLSSSFDR